MKSGTRPASCTTCGGQGQVVATVRTPLGNFQQVTACQACGGSGQTFTPCGTCGGDGRVRRSKRISLRVPAGVDSGSRQGRRAGALAHPLTHFFLSFTFLIFPGPSDTQKETVFSGTSSTMRRPVIHNVNQHLLCRFSLFHSKHLHA